MLTKSEEFFQNFCDFKGIRWKRIAEGDDQTPDYDIFLPRKKVVVEVKELTPNKEELIAEKELQKTGFSSVSSKPGHRIRGKISGANRQIRES